MRVCSPGRQAEDSLTDFVSGVNYVVLRRISKISLAYLDQGSAEKVRDQRQPQTDGNPTAAAIAVVVDGRRDEG